MLSHCYKSQGSDNNELINIKCYIYSDVGFLFECALVRLSLTDFKVRYAKHAVFKKAFLKANGFQLASKD